MTEAIVQLAHVRLKRVGITGVMALAFVQQGFHGILVGRYFMGAGARHIQRVATSGGVAPSSPCGMESIGAKQWVPNQADYIFWKAV